VAIVVDDGFIADSFHIHAWPSGAKRAQANGDAKNAVHVGAHEGEFRHGIVSR
jgi:hypothetical protein